MLENYLRAIIAPLMPGLLNHLWQSTVCLIVAGLLTLMLRKNLARVRYGLWLAASIKFLIPFSLLITLGMHLARPTAELRSAPSAPLFFAVEEVGQPFTKGPHAQERRMTPEEKVDWRYRFMPAVPPIQAAVWLGGFLLVLAGWRRRWRQVADSLRAAEPLRKGRVVEALRRVEQRAGVRKPLEVWLSPTSLEPGIFGIVRPVLVWPAGISEHLQDAHLEAILAHEVWHVRRHDNLAAAIHMVVEAIFWFHPLVWWLGTRLVEEREHACDEEVLQLGGEPHVYAESILKTCEFCLESPLACVSGITGAELKARIVRIMTQRAADKLSLGRKLLLTAVGIAVITGPVVFGLMNAPQIRAQATQTTAGPLPSFEVATVKLNRSGDRGFSIRMPLGRFITTRTTTNFLIAYAYNVKDFQVSGGPGWTASEGYDIDAKVPDSITEEAFKVPFDQIKQQYLLMVQALLADRFKLRLGHETKDLPVLALVVAKNGIKIREAKPGDTYPNGIKDRDGHAIGRTWRMARGQFIGQGLSIDSLVGVLSQYLGRPVLNQTGLKGDYDFTLQWTPDQDEGSMLKGPPGGAPPPDNGPPPDSSGPSIFTAIQEQLGLKLVSTKGPVDILVIDHIERPTEN
jgi:uncharacterized protein (TIGR03435 family)